MGEALLVTVLTDFPLLATTTSLASPARPPASSLPPQSHASPKRHQRRRSLKSRQYPVRQIYQRSLHKIPLLPFLSPHPLLSLPPANNASLLSSALPTTASIPRGHCTGGRSHLWQSLQHYKQPTQSRNKAVHVRLYRDHFLQLNRPLRPQRLSQRRISLWVSTLSFRIRVGLSEKPFWLNADLFRFC